MENKDVNDSRWLSDRLSGLQPGPDWTPDVAQALRHFRQGVVRQRARQRRKIVIAGGFAAFVLVFLAFPITRTLAERYASVCVSLLGGLSDSGNRPVYSNIDYRKPSPEVTLADSAGRAVALSGLRGKVVLLTFSAPQCATCETEISWFKEFQQRYGVQRLVFLSHEVIQDTDDVVRLFGGLDAMPTTLLIDKSGRIAVTHGGSCSKSEFDTAIRALLNEPYNKE
jgi:cytochrome c biogenesis protein CcmG/thiol:disulfide interchange protein DsbE